MKVLNKNPASFDKISQLFDASPAVCIFKTYHTFLPVAKQCRRLGCEFSQEN